MIKHWTHEEELQLLDLKNSGMLLKDIAEVLGRSLEAVRTRSKRLKARENPVNLTWTEEEVALLYEELDYDELLEILNNKTRRSIQSKCEKLGISKRFPGKLGTSGTMLPGKDALLYLVDFGHFKKVGVTQVPLSIRFKQDKPFVLLDSVLMSLEDCLETETEILRNMREYRVIGDLRRGSSECFDYECTLLSDLF